ncbi:MAG: type IV pilus biogenesis protein PilM [Gammaproteobacteria bacterium]
MFLKFIHKKQYLTGIDIDTDEVRVLQICRSKEKLAATGLAISPISPGAMIDGKIRDAAQVISAIKKALLEIKVQKCPVAMALPTQSVMIKRIKLDESLTLPEWEACITANLGQYLPGVPEELCFDFMPTSTQEILLIAARKQQMKDYVNVAEACGLDVKMIDVAAFALVRGAGLFVNADEVCGVIYLTQLESSFIVFKNSEIIFNQPLSWNQIAIQLRTVKQLWVSMHRDIKIDSVVLAGKMIASDEMIQVVAEEFQVCLSMADPLRNMLTEFASQESVQFSSRMLVSCGLALRSLPTW